MINSITHEPITHAALILMGCNFNGVYYIDPKGANLYIIKKPSTSDYWEVSTLKESYPAYTLGDIREIHLQRTGEWLF